MKFWKHVSILMLPAAMMLVMAPAVAQQPAETPTERETGQSGTPAERERGQSGAQTPAGGTTDEDETGRPGGDQPPAAASGREPSSLENRERSANRQAPPPFEEADTDGNGELSKQEADQALTAVRIMDVNGDGKVNKGEVKAALPEISFERDDDEVVDEDAYEEIVAAL